jgi:hypothetical protein
MDILLRRYKILLIPAAIGLLGAALGAAFFVKTMMENSFASEWPAWQAKNMPPVHQVTGPDWNLGR